MILMLYKILIVDDEEEIRLGIIKKIQWEKHGFEIVGDAQNGVEALEKAEKLKPDIIMTDIKMPFMDGLELGDKVLEILPAIKIIIFSGCDDFEYAQKAIRINVTEYVLKPINSKELIEVLKKLKSSLDEEYNRKQNIEILQKHYIESIPIMREQFLTALIEGKVIKSDISKQLDNLEIELPYKHYNVVTIEIDNSQIEKTVFKDNKMLMPIAAKQILDEILEKKFKYTSFVYLDRVIVIGSLKNEYDIKIFINNLNEVCRTFKNILKCDMTMGVGRFIKEIVEIPNSYRESIMALEYRVLLDNVKVIYIDDMEPNNKLKLELSDDLQRKYISALKVGSVKEIEKIIDELLDIDSSRLVSINEYRMYGAEIVMALVSVIRSYNLDVIKILGENFHEALYFKNLNSINEIKNWLKEQSIKVNSHIKDNRINSSKIIVENAISFIKENYMNEDISVDVLCSKLHVSSAYFSTIFKKQVGVTFVNYLTDTRLEEAIKLLNTTDYKTHYIAEKVGYPEANYFSYVFKKKFGISPMRYRKR